MLDPAAPPDRIHDTQPGLHSTSVYIYGGLASADTAATVCSIVRTLRRIRAIDVPPKADPNKMTAAQPNAVFDAFVKFPPIGGEGDGRMVKTTGAVCGPILEELVNTMPAVMQGIPPNKNT
jgi:hypothetical protein